jgi:hypothetical protein
MQHVQVACRLAHTCSWHTHAAGTHMQLAHMCTTSHSNATTHAPSPQQQQHHPPQDEAGALMLLLTFPDITLVLAGAVSTSAGPATSQLDLLLRGQLQLKGAANCSKQCGVRGRCRLAGGAAACECECGWKGRRLQWPVHAAWHLTAAGACSLAPHSGEAAGHASAACLPEASHAVLLTNAH